MIRKKKLGNYHRWAFLFLFPNLCLYVLFFLLPALVGVSFSFTDYNGIGRMNFLGLENYRKAFLDPVFYQVMGRTIIFATIKVIVLFSLSLVLALLLLSKKVIFRNAARMIVYWPTLLSTIMIGLAWRWLLGENFGAVNFFLTSLGFKGVAWSTNPVAAFITTIVAEVWMDTGFYMMLFIGAIQQVDTELHEAASMDGINRFQDFKYITLPLIKPTSYMVILLAMMGSLRSFAVVKTLTGGGPASATTYVTQYIYQTGFKQMDVGYSSAVSMILFAFLLILSLIQMHFVKEEFI